MNRTLGTFVVAVSLAGIPAMAAAGGAFPYVLQWGSSGSANGQFAGPHGLTFKANEVYVADSQNHRIQVFDENGVFLRKFGTWGVNPGQFHSPHGVALDSQGNVYVADRYNHRVQKFSSSGSFIMQWGSLGTEPGQFNSPWNVGVDYNDIVYVVEAENHRVQLFTTQGQWLDGWGELGTGPGQFNLPRGIGFAPDGSIYIAGSGDDRVQKFTQDGSYVLEWGGVHGSNPGEFHHPNGLVVDTDGYVYVLCWYAHPHGGRIQKFTPWGTYIAETGGIQGTGDGEFDHAQGITITPAGDVYVSDTRNHRIERLTQSTATPVKDPGRSASWGKIKSGYR